MEALNKSGQRQFYKIMFQLAVPIIVQNLIQSSLNFVDTLIIGGLGVTAIASVGQANQYFFIIQTLISGVAGSGAIFTAQFWGKKDVENTRKVTSFCLLISFGIAGILAILAFLFPGVIMSIFSTDSQVVRDGSGYIRIASLGFLMLSITAAYSGVLRTMGKVNIPTVVSSIALGINTLLGYGMVYGRFGFKAYGVIGVGYATLLARFLEMFTFIIIVRLKYSEIHFRLQDIFSIKLLFLKEFIRVSAPVIITEFMWSVGVSTYAVAYSAAGTDAVASKNIMNTLEGLSWVTFIGIGNACAIMIGNKIGEGRQDEVVEYSKKFTKICVTLGIVTGSLVIIISPLVLKQFNVSELVRGYAKNNFYVMAVFMWIRVLNFLFGTGLLRSGGDTRWVMNADIISVWFIGVPLAMLGAKVWHLPVYYIYALASMEEVFKLLILAPRVYSRKWIRNVTEAA